MTEQELRALVRSAIAEVRSTAGATYPHPSSGLTSFGPPPDPTAIPLPSIRHHASHALFVIPAQGEGCVIEPAVPCNHCGYCKSYGH